MRAFELAKQAELIDPKNGYTLNVLSCAYAANGNFGKAIQYQKQAYKVEDWKKDDAIDGGVLAKERVTKWRAKEQWSLSVAK